MSFNFINRSNLGLLGFFLGVASFAMSLKDNHDDHNIVAEMFRQVGNADSTGLGTKQVYKFNGAKVALDEKGKAIYRTVPVSAWERIERQNVQISEMSERINVLEQRLQPLDEVEIGILGSDTFWNMARIQFIDGDLDGDSVKNGEDECPDIPGLNSEALWKTETQQTKIGCPTVIDSDKDEVADYRDACPRQPVSQGQTVIDQQVIRGPRSLFPSDQGCIDESSWICDKEGPKTKIIGSPEKGWSLICGKTKWSCGNKAYSDPVTETVVLNRGDCTQTGH